MSTGKTVTKSNSNAFSFIELLIVLSAITVLSTGVFVISKNLLDSSRQSTAKNQVSSISTAIAQYKFETGSYPSSLEELIKSKDKYGPWLSNADKLIDPWGSKLNYVKTRSTTQDNNYISSVWSNGPNKTNDSNSETFGNDDIGIINY